MTDTLYRLDNNWVLSSDCCFIVDLTEYHTIITIFIVDLTEYRTTIVYYTVADKGFDYTIDAII